MSVQRLSLSLSLSLSYEHHILACAFGAQFGQTNRGLLCGDLSGQTNRGLRYGVLSGQTNQGLQFRELSLNMAWITLARETEDLCEFTP